MEALAGGGERRQSAAFVRHPKPPSSLAFHYQNEALRRWLAASCGVRWMVHTKKCPPYSYSATVFRGTQALQLDVVVSILLLAPSTTHFRSQSDHTPVPAGSIAATTKYGARQTSPAAIRRNAGWSCKAAPGNIDTSQVSQSELQITKVGWARICAHHQPTQGIYPTTMAFPPVRKTAAATTHRAG